MSGLLERLSTMSLDEKKSFLDQQVVETGNRITQLKTNNAPKDVILKEVEYLKKVKIEFSKLH